MDSRSRTLLLVCFALAPTMQACNKSDTSPNTTATSATTLTTTPPTAAGASASGVMTVDQALASFKANPAAMMNRPLKITGYYTGYTAQGAQLNVEVTPQTDVSSKGALCIFPSSAQSDLVKIKQKTTIAVSGTVDGEFFGRPRLSGCKLE